MLENTLVIVPSIDETIFAFKDMNISEYMTIFGIACYGLLLAIPLTGIEHRDTITGLTYVGFCMAAGTAWLVAATGSQPKLAEITSHFGVVFALAGVAACRWLLRRYKLQNSSDAAAQAASQAP